MKKSKIFMLFLVILIILMNFSYVSKNNQNNYNTSSTISLHSALAHAGSGEHFHGSITFSVHGPAVYNYGMASNYILAATNARNDFEIAGNYGFSIIDKFNDSGTHTLDPAVDQINVRLIYDDREDEPKYLYELLVDIGHPSALTGKSEMYGFGLLAGGLYADNGKVTGYLPLFVGYNPTYEITRDLMYPIKLVSLAPLRDMRHNVETWTDLMDNQVVMESSITRADEARIVSPSAHAQLTYSTDDPGILEFIARARVSSAWEHELENLVWVLPEIEGSELTTDPEDGKGPVVEVKYTGLPECNSQFGNQKISAYFDTETMLSDPEPVNIQVFFPRDAHNNPHSAQTGSDLVPNWFYSWSQTHICYGIRDFMNYDPVNQIWIHARDGEDPEGERWDWELDEQGRRRRRVWRYGYYTYGHMPYIKEAYDIYICDLGPDFYIENLLTGRPSVEITAIWAELLWENGSADDYDWANPGKQYRGENE